MAILFFYPLHSYAYEDGIFDHVPYEITYSGKVSGASNLFDNNLSTKTIMTDPATITITIELAEAVDINRLFYAGNTKNVYLYFSFYDSAGAEINKVYSYSIPADGYLDVDIKGVQAISIVKITSQSTYELYEFEVYGTYHIPQPPPLEKINNLNLNEGDREVYLSWSVVQGATMYRIYLDGQLLGETVNSYYFVRDLENFREYQFCVSPVSNYGVEGEKTCQIGIPVAPDMIPPDPPYDLVGTASHQSVRLSWKSQPVGDFSHYKIYRDGMYLNKVYFNAYMDNSVQNDVYYSYYVTSVDKSGNESEPSNTVTVMPYDDRPLPPPPPDPNDITDPDIREIGKGMFDIFDSAKTAGLLIVIAAILLGVIFIVSRWLWRLLKRWFAKSGSFGRR